MYAIRSYYAREWTDPQGQKRYTTEIIANEMQMLDGRGAGAGAPMGNAPAAQPQGNWGRPSASYNFV